VDTEVSVFGSAARRDGSDHRGQFSPSAHGDYEHGEDDENGEDGEDGEDDEDEPHAQGADGERGPGLHEVRPDQYARWRLPHQERLQGARQGCEVDRPRGAWVRVSRVAGQPRALTGLAGNSAL
jgi:hypothetical protein